MAKAFIKRTFYFLGGKIVVRIYLEDGIAFGLFEIKGKNISFSQDLLTKGAGMECRYSYGTNEYKNVSYKCTQIRDLFLESNGIVILDNFMGENKRTMCFDTKIK